MTHPLNNIPDWVPYVAGHLAITIFLLGIWKAVEIIYWLSQHIYIK